MWYSNLWLVMALYSILLSRSALFLRRATEVFNSVTGVGLPYLLVASTIFCQHGCFEVLESQKKLRTICRWCLSNILSLNNEWLNKHFQIIKLDTVPLHHIGYSRITISVLIYIYIVLWISWSDFGHTTSPCSFRDSFMGRIPACAYKVS